MVRNTKFGGDTDRNNEYILLAGEGYRECVCVLILPSWFRPLCYYIHDNLLLWGIKFTAINNYTRLGQ